jgi:hypothetical protein
MLAPASRLGISRLEVSGASQQSMNVAPSPFLCAPQPMGVFVADPPRLARKSTSQIVRSHGDPDLGPKAGR